MNRQDLIGDIAAAQDIPKALAARMVDSVLDALHVALKHGDRIELRPFGTFSIADKPARGGQNPRTGEKIEIAAKRVVKFKAAPTLADAVNGL